MTFFILGILRKYRENEDDVFLRPHYALGQKRGKRPRWRPLSTLADVMAKTAISGRYVHLTTSGAAPLQSPGVISNR